MKKPLALLLSSAVSMTMVASLTAAVPALADDNGHQTVVNSTGDHQERDHQGDQNNQDQQDNENWKGGQVQFDIHVKTKHDHIAHKHSKDVKPAVNTDANSNGQGSDSQQNSSKDAAHAAALAQLHTELNQFHNDLRQAHAVHRQLEQSVHDFINALQDAMAAGATTGIEKDTTSAQSVLNTLHTALQDQKLADQSATASTQQQQSGFLSEALQAIAAADKREQAKIAAMQTAATALEALAKDLESAAQAAGSTSTVTTGNNTNTTDNGTTNDTTGQTGSSVTVTTSPTTGN